MLLVCKYFLPVRSLPFHPLDIVCAEQKTFILMKVTLPMTSSMNHPWCRTKSLRHSWSHLGFPLMLSWRHFIFHICFCDSPWVKFCGGREACVWVNLFAVCVQLLGSIVEKTPFYSRSHWLLCQSSLDHIYGVCFWEVRYWGSPDFVFLLQYWVGYSCSFASHTV